MERIMLKEVLHVDGQGEREDGEALFYDILSQNGTTVGSCSLRLWQDRETRFGGNIGYYVSEAFRGKHIASSACELLFHIAREKRMDYVYITCSPDNMGSIRTCERAGCTFLGEEKLPEDTELYQRGERTQLLFRKDLA